MKDGSKGEGRMTIGTREKTEGWEEGEELRMEGEARMMIGMRGKNEDWDEREE